jgi:hypothetical protein
MRFTSSIFAAVLKPIDRRRFKAIVERHDGDAYDKSFGSWQHVLALTFAQLTGADSLRAIETGFNAQSNHHYHLGCGKLSRSTLADANARRPVAVFSELLGMLVNGLGRKARNAAKQALQIIDSTPVPLSHVRLRRLQRPIHGLKLHILHDLEGDCPLAAEITPPMSTTSPSAAACPSQPASPMFSTRVIVTSMVDKYR